jgi:hypothetical protein
MKQTSPLGLLLDRMIKNLSKLPTSQQVRIRLQLKDNLRDNLIVAFGLDDAQALAEGIAWDISRLKARPRHKPNYAQPESQLKESNLPWAVTTEPAVKPAFHKKPSRKRSRNV